MGDLVDRRSWLRLAIHGMGALVGLVLGVPAALFLIDGRNRPARSTGFRTVARLSDLEINRPKDVVITDSRRDAWTLYPTDVIGRVWLIRRPGDQVDAFTAVCPHLGCSINQSGNEFRCPCHGGRFDLHGHRIEEPGHTNPAPRDMDTLAVNPDALRQGIVQVDYREFQRGEKEKSVRS
jgi:menaquinol-cytochrome c reductase iron-sulfur subunit